jgi:dienelactone hydrolase
MRLPILAALSSAILATMAFSASAAMRTHPVEWSIGAERFSGVLVYDDSSDDARPGLVMVPNWKGVSPASVETAKRLAGDDYVVLVADVYGKNVRPKTDAEAGPVASRLRGDRPLLRTRTAQALEVLKQQAGSAPLDVSKLGAVGYCFGGTAVLELARAGAPLAGVVSLHGALGTDLLAGQGAVKAPLLVLNGAADTYVSAEEIAGFGKEMDAAGADWQFVNFSGAVHCFAEADANSGPGCQYDPRAAARAYRMLDGFFDERFDD